MRRGFTIIELVVVVIVVVVLVGLLLPAITVPNRRIPHQLRDATQVRGIGQAMFIWAGNNDEKYPLPSTLDVNNATVPELGRAKDTTANIFALLVDDGSITPQLLISSDERNENISAYEDYETRFPAGAVDPENAIWDPKLTADFTSPGGGNISFAHLIPVGERLDMWASTSKAHEAILSNRGPEMASVSRANSKVTTRFGDPESLTTQFYRSSKNAWSGNIAYNDNHVVYANNLYTHNKNIGTSSDHRTLTGTEDHDVLFADEEGFESNLFLGIFTTAGETKEDYTAIWD
jgi:prepilin-type N-terminal cleavage/methylation domain-containing protein